MYEAVAHRFIDLSEPGFGVALLNNAKYGHNVRGNVLGMSLVRSPVYPDPRADEGVQSFTYALLPHAGDWREVEPTRRAAELGARPRAMLESFHPGSLPAEQSLAEVITTGGDGQVIGRGQRQREDSFGGNVAHLGVVPGEIDRRGDVLIGDQQQVGRLKPGLRDGGQLQYEHCPREPLHAESFRLNVFRDRRPGRFNSRAFPPAEEAGPAPARSWRSAP